MLRMSVSLLIERPRQQHPDKSVYITSPMNIQTRKQHYVYMGIRRINEIHGALLKGVF